MASHLLKYVITAVDPLYTDSTNNDKYAVHVEKYYCGFSPIIYVDNCKKNEEFQACL